MRIAIIGWARLSSQAREGSGYNLNASELARGLALTGHQVAYLSSGMTYRLGAMGRSGGPHVAHRETWGGIDCWELRNSPNIAPAAVNFCNMRKEMSSPESTRLVLTWLDQVGAQIVHIHSLEGLGLDLIAAIRETGRPVIVTPHNYWFLCPQVDLLHLERAVCFDYDGGRQCEGCLPAQNAANVGSARAWGQTLEYLLGLYPADVVRKAAYGVKPLLGALARGRFSRRHTPKVLNPDRLADPELASGFSIGEGDGLIRHNAELEKHEEPLDYTPAPPDANERVLSGTDRHLVVLNDYGRRRRAGIEALRHASLITPPSDYVRRVHVAMGVPEARTRWVRLGQPHFDQINRATRRSPFYATRPWDARTATRPLRFAFFGTTRPNKGLEVLARAIPLLDPAIRRRCHILIHAAGWDLGFRKRLSLYPEVSVWGGYDLYQLISGAAAGGEYDVGILSHIWLENSPLVMLENFHAGKFLICSRLGGPVDWIREPDASRGTPGNGLLFPGGDEASLARCMTRLVKGEIVIPSAREIHEQTVLQSYPEHIREVEGIYRELLSAKSESSAVVRPGSTIAAHAP